MKTDGWEKKRAEIEKKIKTEKNLAKYERLLSKMGEIRMKRCEKLNKKRYTKTNGLEKKFMELEKKFKQQDDFLKREQILKSMMLLLLNDHEKWLRDHNVRLGFHWEEITRRRR